MNIFARVRDRVLSVPRLDELAGRYYSESAAACEANEISPSTLRCRKAGAARVSRDAGHLRPTELTVDYLRDWRRSYAQHPSSWNHTYGCLRWIVRLSRREGWLSNDPLAEVGKLVERRREDHLTPDQLAAAMLLARQVEDAGRCRANRSAGAAIQLLAYTGARHTEITRLRWTGVYLDRRLIHCGTDKVGQQARYGLTDQAVELLRRRPRGTVHVFPGHRDQPITTVRRVWRQICEEIGADCVVHGLRHTWVTEALGVAPMHRVSHAIGHSSEWTTARYGHLSTERIRPVIEAMSARFEEIGGGR